MSATGARDVVSQVIGDVQSQCAAAGVTVDAELVRYVVQKVVVDPAHHFDRHAEFSPDEVDRVVALCVARLTAERTAPELDALRMEVAFDAVLREAEQEHAHRRALAHSTRIELGDEIADLRPKGAAGADALYNKILGYVVLAAGLGAAEDEAVVRETELALESIFPVGEVPKFTSYARREKVENLEEMAPIVAGIRIYNWDSGKGGAGIVDVGATAMAEVNEVARGVSREISAADQHITDYTTVINFIQFQARQDWLSLPTLQGELDNRKLYKNLMERLADDCNGHRETLGELRAALRETLDEIRSLVARRTSVPTSRVYPLFVSLAAVWADLREAAALIGATAQCFERMLGFLASMPVGFTDHHLAKARDAMAALRQQGRRAVSHVDNGVSTRDSEAGDGPAPVDAAGVASTGPVTAAGSISGGGGGGGGGGTDGNQTDGPAEQGTLVHLDDESEALEMDFEFKAFCPWTIVNRRGLLLPGVVSAGVVTFRGRNYLCANTAAVLAFQSDPAAYIRGVERVARETPELAVMLNLSSETISADGAFAGGGGGGVVGAGIDAWEGGDHDHGSAGAPREHPLLYDDERPAMVSAGTETELHPVASHIDPNYEWNEWELRRKALMLVNLRTKRTHSTQTDRSAFRRENATQHYPLKDNGTQTRRDKGTRMPRPQRYISGLRGKPKGRVAVVDLTLDVASYGV